MLMRHETHGWHYATNIEEMKVNGWIESSEEEFKQMVADKHKASNVEDVKHEESAIIEPQQEAVRRKPGRKPKNA